MLSALILTNIAFLPCLCYISTKVLVTSSSPPFSPPLQVGLVNPNGCFLLPPLLVPYIAPLFFY